MSNRIRHYLQQEVEQLLPLLHDTYRVIGQYQKKRSERYETRLLEQLTETGEHLQFFKEHVQAKKQGYFDAILAQQLSVSDRIIALDIAVGAMHVEFSKPRAYAHQESDALRKALEASRILESDTIPEDDGDDDILLRGIPASPGTVSGKIALATKKSDFKRLASGCILVTKMTRPEMVLEVYGKVAGIITDVGGRLCHAAIIARELGIPCIVGCQHATARLKNKWMVSIDGSLGTVKRVI